jgi:hypothetical protein
LSFALLLACAISGSGGSCSRGPGGLTLSRFSVLVAKLRDLPTSPILGYSISFQIEWRRPTFDFFSFLFSLFVPAIWTGLGDGTMPELPVLVVHREQRFFFSFIFDQSIQIRFFSEW